MDINLIMLEILSGPFFPAIFIGSIILVIGIFFILGWKLAVRKNRDRVKWALVISISGFYGLVALAALPKVEENEDE